MAAEGELDFSRERKQVEDFGKSLDLVNSQVNKLNRSSLSQLRDQLDKLSVGGSAELNKLVSDLKKSSSDLERMLIKDGSSVSAVWKKTAASILSDMNRTTGELIRLNNIRVATEAAAIAELNKKKDAARKADATAQGKALEEASKRARKAWSDDLEFQQRVIQLRSGQFDKQRYAATLLEMSNRPQQLSKYDRGFDDTSALQKALAALDARSASLLDASAKNRAEGLRRGKTTIIAAAKAGIKEQNEAIAAAEKQLWVDRVFATAQARSQAVAATASGKADLKVKAAEVDTLSNSFKRLAVDGNDVHSMARGLASGFNLLWLTWGNLVPLFAGAGISFGVKKTFDIGMEVEQNIKMLEVLGDKTTEAGSQIREELRKIDQTTLFSLTELSKTMVELEQAGISGAEALKLVKTSADLAAVGNTNLDVTSKLLTQTMGVFPATAADITKAAAQMFKATKDGKLNIENIGESMRYASTANLMYGQSLEDTLVALQALASVGITNTQAGTGFANMLQDLTGRTGPAKKAIAELEGALGRTIKTMDEKGKARPFLDVINDIQEAMNKFKPEKALDLANKVFSERGLRPLFAAIAKGTVDLTKYKETLESIDPTVLGKSAEKIMETTKGALDIFKGALVGVLDRTFESMGTRFRDLINGMTSNINSQEFMNVMQGMVGAVTSLAAVTLEFLPTLLKLGTAFVAFKAVGLIQAGVVGLAAAMVPLVQMLGAGAYGIGRMAGSAVAGATSVGALGASMLAGSAAARASSVGMDAAGASAAAAAVKMQAATGVTRVLAVTLGFLANPLVGVIATLGLFGAAWWATSRDSQSASDQLSSKVYKDGKVNIAILDEEIRKINERNSVMAEGLGKDRGEIGSLVDKAASDWKSANDNVQRLQAKADSISDARKKAKWDNAVKSARLERDTALSNLQKLQEAEEKLEIQGADRAMAAHRKSIKAKQDADDKARQDAERAAAGLGGKGGSSGRSSFKKDSVEQYEKDNLSSIASTSQSRISALNSRYVTEREILANAHKNQLIDEGTFQAKSLEMVLEYEDNKLKALDEKDKASRDEYDRVNNANKGVLARNLLDVKDNIEEKEKLEKSFAAEIQRVDEKLKSDLANSDQQRVELTNEKYKRMKLAAQDYAGEVIKISKETDDQINSLQLNRANAAAVAELAKQYEMVNDSSMSFLKAQKAGAEAAAQATAEAGKYLDKMDKAIALAIAAAEANAKFLAESGLIFTTEGSSMYSGLLKQVEALQAARAKFSAEAATDITTKTTEAYNKVIAEDVKRLKDGTADAIMTALFEGGKAGKKKLRDMIVAELQKPIRLVVDALVNAFVGSVSGVANSAVGAADSFLGGSGGSAMGSVATATLGSAGQYAATGFMNTVAGTGTSAGLTAGGAIGGMNGFAMQMGAVAPWVLGAIAVLSILSSLDDSGTPHMGGYGGYSATGGSVSGAALRDRSTSPFGLSDDAISEESNVAMVNLSKGIVGMLDTTATTFGKKSGYYAETAFADDSSNDASWGQLLIKDSEGNVKVNWNDSRASRWAPREFSNGEAGAKEYNAAVANDVRNLIKADVPAWADTALDGLGESTNLEDLVKTVAQINAMQLSVVALGRTSQSFADMSEDDIGKLIRAMGGLEGTVSALGSYYGDYYTEAERSAAATASVSEQFTAMGKTMPASRDEFRAMMDAAIAAGDTDLAAKLLKLAPAMAAVARSADDIANERQSLQDQYDELTGNTSALRARELAKLDPSNRLLQQRIWALEKEQEVLDEKLGLEDQYLQLTGNTAEIRSRELEQLDPSNQALQKRIWALEDEAEIISQRRSLEDQYLQLTGKTEAIRARQLASLDASNHALQIQIWALEDQAAAAEKATAAADKYNSSVSEANQFLSGFGQTIRSFIDKLESEAPGAAGYAASESAYSRQLALAASGNRDAMSGLTGYASTYIQAINENASTSFEAAAKIGRVKAQLSSLPSQVSPEQFIVDAIDRQAAMTIASLTENFDSLDVNLDGMLSFDELKAAGLASDETLNTVMAVLDTNSDGQISAIEALGGTLVTSLSANFQSLDKNLDGLLSIDELKASGLASDSTLASILVSLDTNSDGQISAIEAMTGTLAARFAAIDVDLSGAIDYAEFSKNFAGLGSDATLRSIFAELDTNGDGTISRLEAIKTASGETATNTYGLDKATRIKDVVNSLQWGTDAWNSASVKALSTISNQNNWTASDISSALGRFTAQEIVDFFSKYGSTIGAGGIGSTATTGTATTGTSPSFVIGGSAPSTSGGSTGNTGISFVTQPTGNTYIGAGGTAIYDPAAVGRFDSINAYVNKLDWSAAGKASSGAALAAAAAQYGVTAREIAIATGYTEADILALNPNIPRYATGGFHSGGWRLVGEHGPELEYTGESRIFNAAQTSLMLADSYNGEDDSGSAEEMRAMLSEIRALRYDMQAQASANLRMQQRQMRIYERWDGNGLPETRVTT